MKQNLLLTCLFIIYYIPMQAQTPNDTTTVERFNFEAIKDHPNGISFIENNWYVNIHPFHEQFIGGIDKYAPAKEFYLIYSEYHPNGIIKRKARFIGDVVFGKDEYFNERGKLIKSTDEDAKFGKIKPQDLPGHY